VFDGRRFEQSRRRLEGEKQAQLCSGELPSSGQGVRMKSVGLVVVAFASLALAGAALARAMCA